MRASQRRRGSLSLRPHAPFSPQRFSKAEGGRRGPTLVSARKTKPAIVPPAVDTTAHVQKSIWAVDEGVSEDPPDDEFCSGGIANDPVNRLSPHRGRLGTVRRRFAPKLPTEHPAKFLAGHLGTFVGQNRHGVVDAGFLRLHASGAYARNLTAAQPSAVTAHAACFRRLVQVKCAK